MVMDQLCKEFSSAVEDFVVEFGSFENYQDGPLERIDIFIRESDFHAFGVTVRKVDYRGWLVYNKYNRLATYDEFNDAKRRLDEFTIKLKLAGGGKK